MFVFTIMRWFGVPGRNVVDGENFYTCPFYSTLTGAFSGVALGKGREGCSRKKRVRWENVLFLYTSPFYSTLTGAFSGVACESVNKTFVIKGFKNNWVSFGP